MMKSEFETLVAHSVCQEDYEIIETVYMYYPGVEEKSTIAKLYSNFGMIVITDMLPRAIKIREKEMEIQQAKQALHTLNEQLEELKGKEE